MNTSSPINMKNGNAHRTKQARMHDPVHRIYIEAYGVRIQITSNEAAALDEIAAKLPAMLTERHSITRSPDFEHEFHLARSRSKKDTLYKNGEVEFAEVSRNETLELFGSSLRLTVAEHAVGYVFVHAGAVAWRGKAIVIPGKSYTGKTTLTAELVRLGARYYSDEYAVISPNGLVQPFAKPLSIRRGEKDPRQIEHPVGSIGGKAGVRPVRAGLVVITEYQKWARWNPLALTAGQGMMEIIKNTVPVQREPEFVLSVLKRAVDGAAFLKGKRGEAAKAAREILDAADRLSTEKVSK